MSEEERALKDGDSFEFVFAVSADRNAILVIVPSHVEPLLDGAYMEDNHFTGYGELEPGVYRAKAEFSHILGYYEGYRAPGEDDIGFHVYDVEPVAADKQQIAELATEREKSRDFALQLRIAVSYVHRFPQTIGTQLWLEASCKALGIDCPAGEE